MTTIPNLPPLPAVTGDDNLITHDTATNRSGRVSAAALKAYINSGLGSDEISYLFGSVEDQLDKSTRIIANFTALSSTGGFIGDKVYLLGHTVVGRGGGYFICKSSSGMTPDGGTVAVNGGIAWVREDKGFITHIDFGAVSGVPCATFVQAAINSSYSDVVFPDGVWIIESTITPPSNKNIRWAQNAKFKAGANGLTFFKSTTTCYTTKFINPQFDGDGKSSVVAFDMMNFRLNAGIFDPLFLNIDTGFIGRIGCFGLTIENPTSFATPNPILLIADNSAMVIQNPNFDNSVGAGGSGTGFGVTIQPGAGSNLGVRISGGYIQGFENGIVDAGIGTLISEIYFESCTDGDIFGTTSGRNGSYSKCGHWGSVGDSAYKLRNTDGVTISAPVMASGSRTQLYDIDSSNTNCTEYRSLSNASLNSPLGSVQYIGQMSKQTQGSFTPVVTGSSSAGTCTYTKQYGKWIRDGDAVRGEMTVIWTGHTGTGNILITGIPSALTPSTYDAKQFPLQVNTIPFTGPIIYAAFNGSSTNITCYEIATSGVVSLLPLSVAGTLTINFSYSLS